MRKLSNVWTNSRRRDTRRLQRIEVLEDRRVPASMADIVFVMDESGSGTGSNMLQWVKDSVFAPSANAANPISDTLVAQGFDLSSVRYGLVGYAGSGNQGKFGHSYVINVANPDPLFGDVAQMDAALENFVFGNDGEDGWDAFEHVIAEYKFRPGAVPVVIMLQNAEGRNDENQTLTKEGILSTLESKNILVNTLVFGSDASGSPKALFDLAPYGGNSNVRIFGVEADEADSQSDGQHNYYGINTVTNAPTTTAGPTTSQAMQISYNGSNTGPSGMVETGKSVLFTKSIVEGLGPSAGGYRAIEGAATAPSGATLRNSGDGVSLPFGSAGFNFYGTTYTSVRVWEDGVIT